MRSDTPQPLETKERLIDDGLQAVTVKYRQKLARDLLLVPARLPMEWLTPRQRAFLALRKDAVITATAHAAGVELVHHVIHLCDGLVPALVDDFLAGRDIDGPARAGLRQRAPAIVRDVLLRSCPAWPAYGIEALTPEVRAAIDEALTDQLARSANPDPPIMALPDAGPADQRHHEERVLFLTSSTHDRHRRVQGHLWEEQARHGVNVAITLVSCGAVAVLYLVIVLVARTVDPTMTVKEAMMLAGAALTSGGLGILGASLKEKVTRGRSGTESPPARSGDADQARPEPR
ncbi:hypothetical protein AMIS_31880 [Actinoplanes missouriensis 431]|uniref:DUF2335 domain-containing protein n=1 Tax=Actinoplanes missouriensis (strain ATCC 14538 / DSM 43046 / CBS 188.64 / JCM 3121 / NBRC 102363 / NCIMB 12654 / NRRL B-3342 / UNCC 431) TaxID=512565 RepID=I0H5X1_ACTM4|nr:hypothetical protein [Actinoplanes missouriensis]BAL88408.1 hypothetical protein AMIS_31880 [Actinoplanes missouriensis 431]